MSPVATGWEPPLTPLLESATLSGLNLTLRGLALKSCWGPRAQAQVTSWLVMWFMRVGLWEVFETDAPGDVLRMQSFCLLMGLEKHFPSS